MIKVNFLKTFFLWVALSLPYVNASAQSGDIPPHTFTFTVPEGVNVYVGTKLKTNGSEGGGSGMGDRHYVPFVEKSPVHTSVSDGKTTYYYDLSPYLHNYRISKPGALTHVGIFTPNAANQSLEFTGEQLESHSPGETDRDVNNLNGRNMADVFLNINAKGHLKLASGETKQIVSFRNWQAVDTETKNYFIEPDYHYTVNGHGMPMPDNVVVTVSPSGLITAAGTGTAIVFVTYDAMMCAHTTTVGGVPAFFGALWPENTGVFVVSVNMPESGITSNMTVNERWNAEGSGKETDYSVDAELDVFYYEASTGGYDYTFKPEGVTSVTLAQPVLSETQGLQYTGFSTDGVTAHPDGSYTVRLVHGRNIVKLSSAVGLEYQVLSAKPVTYTVKNVTRPGESLLPGDEVSVVFNTLYHPCNKLSGIYNATAGIQYTGFDTDFPLMLGPGQYTFASRAQEYKRTIPESFTGREIVFSNGTIKMNGYTSGAYGLHRTVTLENGIGTNTSAGAHTAFFGSLPDIHIGMDDTGNPDIAGNRINVYPNPFAGYLTIETVADGQAIIYDMTGKTVLRTEVKAGKNRISTAMLLKGVYILKFGDSTVKIVK
jgi:outer membrane lipoprotein-sorting protein